jgi:DNA-binding NtrC family response regulator
MLAPSYQSSILCYSTGSQSLTDLGSEFVADNESCLAALAEHPFKALVVERTLFSNFENLQTFLRNVQSSRSQAQVILLGTQFSTQESILLFNEGLVQFVTSPSKTELESCIPKASCQLELLLQLRDSKRLEWVFAVQLIHMSEHHFA